MSSAVQTLEALFVALVGLIAVYFLSGCSPAAMVNPIAEQASVVVMRTSVELGDDWDGTTDRIVRTPVCGGVATGPREVVTAAHCVPTDVTDVAIVTRHDWFAHTDAFTVATVVTRDQERDVLRLRSSEVLDYTGLSPDSPERVLLVRRFATDFATMEDDVVSGVPFDPGDSGSGVFAEDGRLVAMLVRCFVDERDQCDERGALAVRP